MNNPRNDVSHTVRTQQALSLPNRVSFGVLFTLTLLAGLLLRLRYLARPAYLDESATFIDYARLPYAEIAATYFDPNNHVLYSLLMHASYQAFGFGVVALRLPAFLFGLAVLPLTALVARHLFRDRTITLLATAFAAVSAPLIEYSVSGRGYSIITAAFLLLLWLPSVRRRWAWPVFALVSALGFWALPTMLYPMGIVAAYWGLRLILTRDWPRLMGLIAALFAGAAMTVLLYAPIISSYGLDAITENRHIVPLTLDALTRGLLRLPLDLADYLFIGLPRVARYTLALMTLTAFVGRQTATNATTTPTEGTTNATTPTTGAAIILAVAVIGWLGAWILYQRVIPPTRVWVFLAPVVALWTAAGAVRLARWIPVSGTVRAMALAAIPLMWGALVLRADVNGSYAINSGAHDAAAAAAVIANELPPDADVLFVAGWVHPLWYYLDAAGLPRERVQLNRPAGRPLSDPAYLLTFTDDRFLDNRTTEAFGRTFAPAELSHLETFATGEWTLWEIRE
ncbi:MAG: hypothetical protein AAF125_09685 [Chloroflexota bacterium]